MNHRLRVNKESLTVNSYLYILFLWVIILLVYYPIIYNGFIYQWDDQWQVFTATTEDGFNWDNIKAMFTRSFHNQYFPVNQLFYMVVYSLAGDYNPVAFHVFSLVLHIINSWLVYFLFVKMLCLSGRMEKQRIPAVAFITALIFAIHPLNVESVAWISASKILVYAFFFLLSLYSYVLYLEKKKGYYLFLSLLAFVLSFGGKEQAVILPLCLVVIDWLERRNFRHIDLWIEKMPFVLLSLLMGMITMYVSHGHLMPASEGYSLWERIIFCCYSYSEYIFKWILPVRLLYLYPFPSLPGESIPVWLYSYPVLIAVIFFSFRKLFRSEWALAFGLLFFTVNLLMTLHIIPMPRFAIVADRYIYLSSAGLSFVVGFYFVRYYLKPGKYKKLVSTLFIVYLICLGIYSNIRTRVWHDSVSLKKEVRELLEKRNEFYEEYAGDNENELDSK